MSKDVRIFLALTLLFAGLYLLTLRGTHESVDDIPRYNLTIALLTKGTIEVPPSLMASPTSVDGRVYSKYGIGMSLLMVPFYAAGRAIEHVAPEALRRAMGRPTIFAMSTTNQWLGALACGLLFLLGRRVGFRERTALLVALSAGLGSMLWLSAQTSFDNVPVALMVEIAALALIGEGAAGAGSALAAGGAMGFVFLTRWGDGWILLPGAIALLAARIARTRGDGRRGLALSAAAFTVPLILGIALAMAYNWARFLDPFELGYDDDNVSLRFLPSGLFGLLFSPAKSVFVFTPLLAVAIAGFGRLWRRLGGGLRGAGFFWMVAAPLAAYSIFETWDGGWCFGPRYLLPSVVLALLGLGEWIEDERWGRSLRRPAIFATLFALGLYAQLVCLASNFNDYSSAYYAFRFDPRACPLLACPQGFVRPRENLWFWKLLASPDVELGNLAVLLVPLGLAAAGAAGIRRELAALWSDAVERLGPAKPKIARAALAIASLAALLYLVPWAGATLRSLLTPKGAGLTATYFATARWEPPRLFTRIDPGIDFDWSDGRRPTKGDFSVRWEGEIEAPTSGTYFFALDSCGTATLWLDDKPVIFNPGPHRGRRLFIYSVRLAKGRHPIRVEFASKPSLDRYEINGAKYERERRLPTGLTLLWKPPGALFLRKVPARVLRPKKPEGFPT